MNVICMTLLATIGAEQQHRRMVSFTLDFTVLFGLLSSCVTLKNVQFNSKIQLIMNVPYKCREIWQLFKLFECIIYLLNFLHYFLRIQTTMYPAIQYIAYIRQRVSWPTFFTLNNTRGGENAMQRYAEMKITRSKNPKSKQNFYSHMSLPRHKLY